MSHAPNHAQARTTALAARHTLRALAQCLTANQQEISAEDTTALAVEMREILTTSHTVLHEIERATPDRDTAHDVRDSRHHIEDATRALANSYPTESTTASGDEFTRITEPAGIETLAPGRELIVGGTLYRISRSEDQVIVSDLTDTAHWSPHVFIERFRQSRFGILLRH